LNEEPAQKKILPSPRYTDSGNTSGLKNHEIDAFIPREEMAAIDI
jgi:hypothetical protein